MVTVLFSVHTITEAKQWVGRSQGGGSSSQVICAATVGLMPCMFTQMADKASNQSTAVIIIN